MNNEQLTGELFESLRPHINAIVEMTNDKKVARYLCESLVIEVMKILSYDIFDIDNEEQRKDGLNMYVEQFLSATQ